MQRSRFLFRSFPVEVVRLTTREKQVLERICRDEETKHIAHALGIAPAAVRKVISGMMVTLGCRGRVGLVIWAMQHPDALATGTAESGFHLPGCTCESVYCTAMRAGIEPQPKAA